MMALLKLHVCFNNLVYAGGVGHFYTTDRKFSDSGTGTNLLGHPAQNTRHFQHGGSFDQSPYGQPAHIALISTCCILLIEQESKTNNQTIIQRGDIMAENKVQDYTDDKNKGHVDTREANFECEKKDENLGCDMGIDVAG